MVYRFIRLIKTVPMEKGIAGSMPGWGLGGNRIVIVDKDVFVLIFEAVD